MRSGSCAVAGIALALAGCATTAPIPPQGRFGVDGYELAYACAGSGRPVVILEPPSGISAEEAFAPVFERIAATTRVCRYERLGFGDSEPVPEGLNQTVADYSRELAAFVDYAAPREPLVLVGYSFGGFIVRYFAAEQPTRVRGLLLIDAAQEDWIADLKIAMRPDDWARMQAILDWFVDNLGHNYWDSQALVAATRLPLDLPVRLISRGVAYERIRQAGISEEAFVLYNDLHDRGQKRLESLTDRTTRVIAENSQHLIVESEPELVMAELALLLDAARR